MSKVKVGIIGATGYVGVELIRLLNAHPQVELSAIGSNSFVDKSITEVYPSVGIGNDMKCMKNEDVIAILYLQLYHLVLAKNLYYKQLKKIKKLLI